LTKNLILLPGFKAIFNTRYR